MELIQQKCTPAFLLEGETMVILEANEIMCRILEYRHEELKGKHILDFRASSEIQQANESIEIYKSELKYYGSGHYVKKNGETIKVRVCGNRYNIGQKSYWLVEFLKIY